MRIAPAIIVLTALTVVAAAATAAGPGPVTWETAADGLEIGRFATDAAATDAARVTVVRIDPARWRLELASRDKDAGEPGRTAEQWAAERSFVAVINAGMFATDYTTHVGYQMNRGEVESSHVNHYQSVAAFHPHEPAGDTPPFRIFDLDEPDVTVKSIGDRYASLTQNLRLIKRPGENRWPQQERRWSEAALGEDGSGRILFVFCRDPFTMHDLNEILLAADLDLVALQHLEGGPEAQLFLSVGDHRLDLVGSFETGFFPEDSNVTAWPVPNVLGIVPRAAQTTQARTHR